MRACELAPSGQPAATLRAIRADITTLPVDAIVNAATATTLPDLRLSP